MTEDISSFESSLEQWGEWEGAPNGFAQCLERSMKETTQITLQETSHGTVKEVFHETLDETTLETIHEDTQTSTETITQISTQISSQEFIHAEGATLDIKHENVQEITQVTKKKSKRKAKKRSKHTSPKNRFTNRHVQSLAMAYWMTDMYDEIKDVPLRELCLVGSHDAGMSVVLGGRWTFRKGLIKTQYVSVGEQLKLGVRYFDIRPAIAGNPEYFATGHYSKINSRIGWAGGLGESLSDIIDGVNEFAKTGREIIFLKISHTLNTNNKKGRYRRFNDEEWGRLFLELSRIKNLFFAPANVNLLELKVCDFFDTNKWNDALCEKNIVQEHHASHASFVDEREANYTSPMQENGSKVVVLIPQSEYNNLGEFHGKGFFYCSSPFNPEFANIKIFNQFSNTTSARKMIRDQLWKLHHYNNHFFLLSWTLTPQGITKSVKSLAKKANEKFEKLIEEVHRSNKYPNIIHLDYISGEKAARMAADFTRQRKNLYISRKEPSNPPNVNVMSLETSYPPFSDGPNCEEFITEERGEDFNLEMNIDEPGSLLDLDDC